MQHWFANTLNIREKFSNFYNTFAAHFNERYSKIQYILSYNIEYDYFQCITLNIDFSELSIYFNKSLYEYN